jgi:hypothetical protein
MGLLSLSWSLDAMFNFHLNELLPGHSASTDGYHLDNSFLAWMATEVATHNRQRSRHLVFELKVWLELNLPAPGHAVGSRLHHLDTDDCRGPIDVSSGPRFDLRIRRFDSCDSCEDCYELKYADVEPERFLLRLSTGSVVDSFDEKLDDCLMGF